MREIKFRAWHKETETMLFVGDKFGTVHPLDCVVYAKNGQDVILMEYTGLKDKNGKDIYEGDVFRIEEPQDDECDQCDGCGWTEGGDTLKEECPHCNGAGSFIGKDRFIYVVITWVQEWCMFATLRVEDEYPAYLQGGVKALDEPMFWTYTLEDTDSRKHFLCGNIYEQPQLLCQP